jgi:hypothetical protein
MSKSMIFETATTHALSDTMSIGGEHWFIEAVLSATGVTKRQRVEGTKYLSMGWPAGVVLLHSLLLLLFLCITAR